MKKFVTIVCTLALSGVLAFAQTTGDKSKPADKPADAPKTETKAKKHKHHKAKKAKKSSDSSTTTGTSTPK
ncbi:MAG TPA: hypothetical protein VF532_14950 [Candidatus Angelobacter sp.]